MKISEGVEKIINEQIREELESAYLYLSMAAWFESLDLPGCARWMRIQHSEELSHASKMFEYLLERDGKPRVPGLKQPKAEWKSPLDAFEAAYAHEQHITACIYDIVKLARAEGDLGTENFYGYFIKEQVEEETNALALVKKFKFIGDNRLATYNLDKELGSREDE